MQLNDNESSIINMRDAVVCRRDTIKEAESGKEWALLRIYFKSFTQESPFDFVYESHDVAHQDHFRITEWIAINGG